MTTCDRCRLGDCACIREKNGGPMVVSARKRRTSEKGGAQLVEHQEATPEPPPPPNLIKAMAMAVGKSLAAYVEVMYPEAIKAASSTFKLSLRNHTYNTIMHVSTLHTEEEIHKWLTTNEAFRKKWLNMYRKMRRNDRRASTPASPQSPRD